MSISKDNQNFQDDTNDIKKICINCPKNIECDNIDCLKTYCIKCYAYCEFELLNCNIQLDLQCPYCVSSYCASTYNDEYIKVCGNCLRCSNWCKTCDIIYDSDDESLIKKHKSHLVYECQDDKSFDMFIQTHSLE